MLWLILSLAALAGVYAFVIRPKLREIRVVAGVFDQLDDYALKGWSRLSLRLQGLKTWSLGVAGVVVAALPGALEQLHLVDFSAFFPPETALKISGAIMLAMTITHILGVAKAVEIEPKKGEGE